METKIGVILAAGRGERLDMQDNIKSLVHIGGKPIILRDIELMQEIGVEKIYIVLGYKGELIKKELIGNPYVKVNIDYIENQQWKGGMLTSLLCIDIKSSFYLSPCDLFFEKNPFQSFVDEDLSYEGVTTLVFHKDIEEDRSGARSKIKQNNDGSICHSTTEFDSIESGIYLFGKGMIDKIKSIVQEKPELNSLFSVMEHISKEGRLKLRFIDRQEWFDINTPSIRIRAEMFLRKMPTQEYHKNYSEKKSFILKPFTSFTTKREIKTEIYVQRDCLQNLGTFEIIPDSHAESPHFIITDENVNTLFGEHLYEKLKLMGYKMRKIVLSSGETTKTLQNYMSLSERILAEGIDEHSILISLGGGTVTNITGFLASTLYRGIYLIHIPTTLMAQCDAAIGIKQAVNGDKGKNLIGSYYEPLKIIVDPALLITSSEKWLKDGLVECFKHAIAQDYDYYRYLIDYEGSIKDIEFLDYVVRKNIELKIKIMEDDPKEHGEALLLQYGHTIGHAVEYLSGYKLGHGESIGIGMVAAAKISKVLDISNDNLVDAHYDIFNKYGLRLTIPDFMLPDDIITSLRYNKRYLYGDIQFVLLNKIGSLWNYNGDYSIPCESAIIKKALHECY